MEEGSQPASALEASEDRALLDALRPRAARSYELTRFVFLRALGFVYSVAFLVLFEQHAPLLGSRGLLPAARYVAQLKRYESFWDRPTLFWFDVSDRALAWGAGIGLGLALAVMCGIENAIVMGALWALYLSYVHIGQIFYGYGWESLLLETGFLAIFICPLRHVMCLHDPSAPGPSVFWLLRWLLFRVMFGAGLIKLRGDPCWRDLTCLIYHYETQPVPHVLSWVISQAPPWFHRIGTAFNHFVELVVPWFLLAPRPQLRHWAAGFTIAFQVMLILSGNLSFLNWLTIAVALGCIDDAFWQRALPGAWVRRAAREPQPARVRTGVQVALCCLIAFLSISPVLNMLSPHQRMNTSFEPLNLVNSYGAFGSVGRERDEVILQGTSDADPGPSAHWVEYEFKCKPGAVSRRPCWITPYHYRLDWQMWFAAMSDIESEPWLVHLVYKLLHNDQAALSLLAKNPFPNRAPRFIRAERYRYHFTRFGERDYWRRERLDVFMPALSREDPRLLEYLAQYGLVSQKLEF